MRAATALVISCFCVFIAITAYKHHYRQDMRVLSSIQGDIDIINAYRLDYVEELCYSKVWKEGLIGMNSISLLPSDKNHRNSLKFIREKGVPS